MRKILVLLTAIVILTACSGSGQPEGDVAAHAAKEYYDSLFAGNAKYFVRGMYMAGTIPDDYRSQLEANAKMFVARQNDEHHGVKEVRILNCVNDTVTLKDKSSKVHMANAFLVFCFGDSLNEEVVVRMIEHKGRWLML